MAKTSNAAIGGMILHAVAVRVRVTGLGNLNVVLNGYDDTDETELSDIVMAALPGREPTVLANFSNQAVQLTLQTVEISDNFLISKIAIFVKPVSESYPIL